MKQKRTYVTLLLIVALLVLGVAYAAFTADELQITGTATASVADGNVDVQFVAVDPAKAEGVTTYGELGTGDDVDTATITVAGLQTANESKTVTFTIENKTENGVPVTLGVPTVEWDNKEWYEVTTEYGNNDVDLAAAGAADEADRTTLAVTVKLLKTVGTTADETAAKENNIAITLNAEAAANN